MFKTPSTLIIGTARSVLKIAQHIQINLDNSTLQIECDRPTWVQIAQQADLKEDWLTKTGLKLEFLLVEPADLPQRAEEK